MTKNYRITGPSTEAAVDSLIDEVTLIEGTHTVDVDTDRGVMTVMGEDFSSEEIAQAAKNAGFALAE
ncbi:hypothetical protein CGLAU_11860 [Corynebacterium glaucum]|uniref:Transporter n=1 Tax=Corynebacterium glaucum TaxID=187491 RepID=A0A1Q2HZU8_9CORY|nr:transporter [Corynebacterium glaucum]AQQ16300.1 hypothetical protein CGLAU_11860 [Corynebacterium glaucum]WJZ08802.1 hypothetical protein CGLAUT_11750 [Corynebacterium glaucum]